ncbi:MAG TPA: response regulator [Bacteroidia bacterium]|nr:response regulator [Bacteroidia bacterium]
METQVTFFLIDDDEDDRELFEVALEKIHIPIKFKSAANGIEALQSLQVDVALPDYIFLDLNMPQMDGRECLIALKNDTRLAQIPVIIFSTSNDPRDKEDTQKLGAIDFITKPFKTSELTKVLSEFITKNYLTLK